MKILLRDIRVHAALFLSDAERDWIHQMKFSRFLARGDLDILASLASRELERMRCDFDGVVSLPSHPLRSLVQVDLSYEWARCVAERAGRPLLRASLSHASLARALLSSPQKRLSAAERRERFAEHARFKATSCHARTHPRILLCDDVLNTGTSFLEARQALTTAGYHVIGGLLLASTRPPGKF